MDRMYYRMMSLCALVAVISVMAQAERHPRADDRRQPSIVTSDFADTDQQSQEHPNNQRSKLVSAPNQGGQSVATANQVQSVVSRLMQVQQNLPKNQVGTQRVQLSSNQLTTALTSLLQRGLTLPQAVQTLTTALVGQTQSLIPTSGLTGGVSALPTGLTSGLPNLLDLSALTNPLDNILGQTGLPLQLSSLTNPIGQNLNGLLNGLLNPASAIFRQGG